ncbi:MAG TPA: methyltransferase domain-containing protein [Mycobacteriales bacterium]|nr:methyltransferase domain-containing protein [Mycobacteriales bacterium]
MDVRDLVRGHYGSAGLSEAVLGALSSAGVDVEHLTASDLYPVDHLHAGGAAATEHVLSRLGVAPGTRLLDVGSGLGGPARMAATSGATVTGIDLVEEFVDAANDLTARVGLQERARFLATPGETLPFEDGSFDAAVMVHVGMNVPDKDAVFAEVHRVLAPGSPFALYEQMSTGAGDPPYPLPWAQDARSSFLETVEDYTRRLGAAGFQVEEVEDRTEAITGNRQGAALSPVDVFGEAFAERVGNHVTATRAGLLRSVLVLASA